MSDAFTIDSDTYQEAFYKAPIGMTLVAPDGKWLETNEAMSEIVGYSKEELLDLTFQDITYKEDLDKDLALVEEVLKGKRNRYRLKKRYVTKDKKIIWVLINVTLVREDDQPKYFIAHIVDINEQKIFEEKLEEKVSQLTKLKDLMLNREERVVELKKRVKELEELMDRN